MCLAEVARLEHVKADALYRRYNKGMTIEQAVQSARKLG